MSDDSEEPKGRELSAEETRAKMDRWREAEDRRHAEVKAEALANGKEPFDLSAFYEVYRAARPFPEPPPEEAGPIWERRYFDSIRHLTVREFAEFMNLTDVYDGGDMHID